jgi:hypothetical protein
MNSNDLNSHTMACSSHWRYHLAYHLNALYEVAWKSEVPQLMLWLCVEGMHPSLRQKMHCMYLKARHAYLLGHGSHLRMGGCWCGCHKRICTSRSSQPIFVRIDDQMEDWIEDTMGKRPDIFLMLPVMCAFQCHPAFGTSWVDNVDQLLVT